jgi:hypothetical protein
MSTPAPAPSPVTAYPFDSTGSAITNKVPGERQVISPIDYSDFNVIMPLAAPFYGPSMKVVLYPSGTPLVEGVDYTLSYYFIEATRSIGIPVYGALTFYNNNLSGVISMTYQTVGGQWTLTEPQITAILANIVADPRITTWEQVANIPSQFPPINHVWEINDMVNMDSVVAAITQLTAAVGTAQTNTLNSHLINYGNPHLVTAAQTGAYTTSQVDLKISNLQNQISQLQAQYVAMQGQINSIQTPAH